MTSPTIADYFRYDDEAHRLWPQLRRTQDSRIRARILLRAAEIDEHKSILHTALFGEDPHPYDGAPQADWLAESARLLRIVAAAEHCRATGRPWTLWSSEYLDHHDIRAGELQNAAARLLDEFVRGGHRGMLLSEMVDVWDPMTTGQAVETIACIPVPRGWPAGLRRLVRALARKP